MSKKYRVDGPDGEIIMFHFQDITRVLLMAGCTQRYKPFMDHLLFTVMGYSQSDIDREGLRQVYRYRYYINTTKPFFKERWYRVMDKYNVTEVESIIKHS